MLILFGSYRGTERKPGLGQPLLRQRLKLAADGERLKVNDMRGNPVAIAAVPVWRVEDTAKGVLDLDQEHKATRVSNPMVVLCGESAINPVVNTSPAMG